MGASGATGVLQVVLGDVRILASVAVALLLIVGLLLGRRRPGTEMAEEEGRDRFLSPWRLLGAASVVLVFVWHRSLGLGGLVRGFMTRDVFNNVVWTLIVCGVFVVALDAARHVLLSRAHSVTDRHKVRRTIYWSKFGLCLLAIVLIWGTRVENLGVFLGIVGAGLALSLQEILLSVAGWLYLVAKRPFDVGDRVEIQGQIGDVIDVGVLHSALLEVGNWVGADQSTGRIVTVPNSMLLRASLFNYTTGFPFIWNEIEVVVTFESNWRRAKEVMLQRSQQEADKIAVEVDRQIRQLQQRYAMATYKNLTPIVYTTIANEGVRLTLRHLTPVRKRRTVTHQICEGILDDIIAAPDVDFAYPTTRFFDNIAEGKQATRVTRPD